MLAMMTVAGGDAVSEVSGVKFSFGQTAPLKAVIIVMFLGGALAYIFKKLGDSMRTLDAQSRETKRHYASVTVAVLLLYYAALCYVSIPEATKEWSTACLQVNTIVVPVMFLAVGSSLFWIFMLRLNLLDPRMFYFFGSMLFILVSVFFVLTFTIHQYAHDPTHNEPSCSDKSTTKCISTSTSLFTPAVISILAAFFFSAWEYAEATRIRAPMRCD